MSGTLQEPTKETHLKLVSEKANKVAKDAVSDHAPEALFISALLESGDYNPAYYGITSEHIRGHKPIHEFCMRYQQESGVAPPLHLLMNKYPQFPFIKEIHPSWAASELAQAHIGRSLRVALAKALTSVNEEAYGEAVEVLKNGISQVQPAKSQGVNAFDISILDSIQHVDKCAVPAGKIQEYTGGIGRGDLWYIAARPGVGKSWRLAQHALAAMQSGWDVSFFSLEMNAAAVADRIWRLALNFKGPWLELEKDQKVDLINEWSSQSGLGVLSIYDTDEKRNGIKRCDPSVIASNSGDKTLAIVDYVGLMYTSAGQKAIEDWRVMATISNQLKEIAITQNLPIIAAAQINRAGAGKDAHSIGLEHMAQADALGQDADAVMTIREYSTHVRQNNLVKYRHGSSGDEWYSQFNPTMGSFEDITPAQAHRIKEDDDYVLEIGR